MKPVVALTMMVALLISAAVALGAGVSLDRSPTPPQAVAPGQGTQKLTFTISYLSVAERYEFTITDPQGRTIVNTPQTVTGQPSPISNQIEWAPPTDAVPGRYTAAVKYFSSTGLEATATVTFDVAAQLGTLKLVKFEDLNGNGTQEAGERNVPNWGFRLTNPQGNLSQATTGPDGTITLPNVPAGTWNVEEIMQTGWVALTGTSTTVQVAPNATSTVVMGNARPAPLSGMVWIDSNANQIRDNGEVVRSNSILTLTGTTGMGNTVTSTAVTGTDGNYEFPSLLPGNYSVSVTVPDGLTLTTPGTIGDRIITSGVGSPNNNFGLRKPIKSETASVPRPDIRITKSAPKTVNRGAVFTYKIGVSNRSSFTARNVVVTDAIPADLSLVEIPRGATIRNGVVTWKLGNMKARSSRSLSMRVKVNPTSTTKRIINTAQVTATGLPPRRAKAPTNIKDPKKVTRRAGAVTG